MITGLDHVVVLVRDIAAGTDAYQTLFARAPAWRSAGNGAQHVLFTLDNMTLELMAPDGEGAVADRIRSVISEQGEGLASLCFRTDDIARMHRRLDRLALQPEPVTEAASHDAASGTTMSWKRTRAATDATRGVRLFFLELAPRLTSALFAPLPPRALARGGEGLGVGGGAAFTEAAVPADRSPTPNPFPPLRGGRGEERCAEPSEVEIALVHERPLSVVTATAPVTAMDHIVISTADPERAAALYGARLGLDMALDRSRPDWGRLMFFRCGDLIVELVHRPGQDSGADHDRLWGLSWRVADIDATRARLVSAGVDVSDTRPGRKPGTRVLTVRSSACGIPTLLVERTSQA